MSQLKIMFNIRVVLMIIWLVGLVISLSVLFYIHAKNWIGAENFKMMIKQLNTLYAPFIGSILGFHWLHRSKPSVVNEHAVDTSNAKLAGAIAVVFSLLWNGGVAAAMLILLFENGTVEGALEFFSTIQTVFLGAAGAALGYFFGADVNGRE